jgi:hypothetical protein
LELAINYTWTSHISLSERPTTVTRHLSIECITIGIGLLLEMENACEANERFAPSNQNWTQRSRVQKQHNCIISGNINTGRRSHAQLLPVFRDNPEILDIKTQPTLYQEDSVQAAVILPRASAFIVKSGASKEKKTYLWVVCDLCVTTPSNLARGCDDT